MTSISAIPEGAAVPSSVSIGGSVNAKADASERPDCERPALARMRPKWELPDLLMGGTAAMQEAGTKVLPQEPDEGEEEYKRRKNRTVLTNYYGNTLSTHSGLPFGTPVAFDPPLPDLMAYLAEDADGRGRSITVLARDFLRDAMHRGLSHLLVDIPSGVAADFGETMRRRPRIIHIQPGDALDIKDEPDESGREAVSYLRLRQASTKAKGRFGSEEIETILEIAANAVVDDEGTRASYSVEWLKHDDEWVASPQTAYSRTSVPFFTLYANQTGEFEGEPAYAALAELNRAHYQSDADQRHGLSYGRRATVVTSGTKAPSGNPAEEAAKAAAGQGTDTKKVVLGYARRINIADPAGKAYLLETGGAPLAAGRDDLADLEQRMERFGAQQVSKGGGITALSRKLDNQRDTCNLEAWCTRLEGVLLHAIRSVAEWMNIKLPAGQVVKIQRDFADSAPKDEHMPIIQALGKDGFLSPATVIRETMARGILATVKSADDEIEAVATWKEENAMAEIDRQVARAKEEEDGVDQPGDAPAGPDEPDAPGRANPFAAAGGRG